MLVKFIRLQIKYNEAIAAREKGYYRQAIEAFTELGDFKDSKTQISAMYYESGESLRDRQKWDDAVKAFTSAGDYSDAKKQISRTYYEQGKALLSSGKYDAAITAFTSAGSYSDASAQINEAINQKSKTLLDEDKFDETILAEHAELQYSVTIIDNLTDEEGNIPEEGEELFTVTAVAGADIDYGGYSMPEKDGEYVFYTTSKTAVSDDNIRPTTLPSTIPESDVIYYVSNVKGNFVELYVSAEAAQDSGFVEYFPMLMEDAELQAYMYYSYYRQMVDAHELYDTALETLADKPEEEKDYYRLFVKEGVDLNEVLASVIVHTHDGTSIAWMTEDGQDVSGVMGIERIKLYASF